MGNPQAIGIELKDPMQKQEDELLSELEILAVLLTKYGNGAQAHFVESLIRLKKRSNSDFEEELASIEMWGGAGAVWEVPKFKEDWMSHVMGKEADADELRFREAIIYLANYMNTNRIGSDDIRERARFTADTFNYWIEKGI